MTQQTESSRGFDTRTYWEERLTASPDLRGTGQRQFSPAYNQAMYRVATQNLQQALARSGVALPGAQVLDVGSGLGYFVERFLAWGAAHVTGIELTQVGVKHLAEAFPEQTFCCADIADPALRTAPRYDLVSAISVIFHILEEAAFQQALRNMCQSVRPGGHLLIVDAFARSWIPSARHARLRSMDAYQGILAEHGLHVVHLQPMYYLMGRPLIPVIGPTLLSWQPALRSLTRLEQWLGARSIGNGSWLKYMVARRDS